MRRSIGVAFACAAAACGGESEEKWGVVFELLDAGLVSVSGTSSSDVWAVGGDPGSGPFVLHFDGGQWKKHATGSTGDLWWVHPFAGGPVFFGGAGGQILRYQNGAFERMTTPGMSTVFGVWGSSPADVWAVGGEPSGAGFVWRFDGTAWTDAPGVPAGALATNTAFKVWGNGPNDVWIVGSGGLVLRWDGTQLTRQDSATTRTLFTVYTAGDLAVAVGGFGSGVIVENTGSGWTDVASASTPQMNGVVLTPSGDGYAVGLSTGVLARRNGLWEREMTGLNLGEDLHGVWIDPDGGVWAVGGQVLSLPLTEGTLIHKGPAIPGGTFVE